MSVKATESTEFVAEYVQECIINGIQCPADIRKKAEEEISTINEEIKKIEELRNKQALLRAVIQNMGGGKTKKSSGTTQDFSMAWKDLDDDYKDLCVKICKFVQENGESTPRGIINGVSHYQEQKPVISALKTLEHKGVLKRRVTDDASFFGAGDGWEKFLSELSP